MSAKTEMWLSVLARKISGQVFLMFWVVIVTASAAINIYLSYQHAEEVALAHSKTMFDHIVLTRKWNAQHGGVYVPVTEKTRPNPYLKAPDRDVVTDKGQRLTKINPAYMTRQVSELVHKAGGTQFNITSLDPIRPKNAPTDWERVALESFEHGVKETGVFIEEEHKFRYMAPLVTEKPCLKCHEKQGYKLGDIRGGISVNYPAEEILHNREHAIVNTVVVHVIVLVMTYLVFIFYVRSRRHLQRLSVEKESANQANKFKGAFIANISHELRTPLNAIIGMSHILDQEALTTGQKSSLQKISNAGKRLNTIINQMLDFSRLDAETMELNNAPLQLRQVVEESIELLQDKAQGKGLTLSAEFSPQLPEWLRGDALHIQQILLHVIDNAIKFTESGSVSVVLTAEPGAATDFAVTIKIEDTGIGIEKSPEWLEQHDFAQLEDFHTRRQGGLGLGLTLSRKLLALMGGSMQIESRLGRGTSVFIKLQLEVAEKPDGTISQVVEAPATEQQAGQLEAVGSVTLTQAQRQQLHEQLSRLVEMLGSDFPSAMELLTGMIEQYQGSDYQQALAILSEKMASFENDAVVEQCQSMQEKLSNKQ